MKIIKNKSMYSLNNKYQTIEDSLFVTTNGSNNWMSKTNELRLLSLLCGSIDFFIAQRFEVDDVLFNALENEYKYVGFTFDRSEIKPLLDSLVNMGYLDIV